MGKGVKYVFAALAAAVLVLPGISSAQSVGDLQTQIQALSQQVELLQAQLAAQQGMAGGNAGSTAANSCSVFNTNLTFGSTGATVTALQAALQKDGEFVQITGVYDNQTAAAVTVFQEKYASAILSPSGLTNGTGYTGAATRAQLNSLYGCKSSQAGSAAVTNVWPWPVSVTAPAAGATLAPGQAATITWITIPTNLETITLLQNGAPVAMIGMAPSVPGGNSGTVQAYPWTVPADLSGSGFQVRVTANGSDAVALSGMFSIGVAPSAPAPASSSVPSATTTVPTVSTATVPAADVGSLTVSPYDTFQSVIAPGTAQAVIGQYTIFASIAEQVRINTIEIQAGSSYFQNLKVLLNGVQFGTVQGSVTKSSLYFFTGSPVTIPAGGSVGFQVIADVATAATGSASPATNLAGVIGNGATTGASIISNGVAGQSASFGTAGQQSAALSVSLDSSSPAAGQLVMGSTGNVLAAYQFVNTSGAEDVKVTDLQIVDVTGAGRASFMNVGLWKGGTALGTAGAPQAVSGGYLYTFHFGVPVTVPENGSVVLTLKGDVASYFSQGVADNSANAFQVSQVTALGASSSAAIAPTLLGAKGNTMTVLRTTLAPRVIALGVASNRILSLIDNLATISFVANSAGSARLNSLTLTFSGNAVNSAFVNSAKLLDLNNVDVTAGDGASAAVGACSALTCTKTWTFADGANAFFISAGSNYTFVLQANDTLLSVSSANVLPSVMVAIQSAGDVRYADGADAAAVQNIPLPPSAVPLQVAAVSFAAGTVPSTGTGAGTGAAVAPTVNVSVTPQAITLGQSVTFSWNSTNATACTGSRSGTYATSGSFVTTPPSLPYTYGMSCSGPGGTSPAASVTVFAVSAPATTPPPTPAAAPTVSLSVSPSTITQGQTVTLTWSSANAAGCGLTDGTNNYGSAFSATNGSQAVTPARSGSVIYTMACVGAGGSAAKAVTVTVNAPASTVPPATPPSTSLPTVTLSLSPSIITVGQATTIIWNSTNAVSCSLTNGIAAYGSSAFSATSGQVATTPTVAGTYTYSMKCVNASGSYSTPSTATLTVNPAPAAPPTVSLSASPSSITQGQSVTLTWSSANAASCSLNTGASGFSAVGGSQSVTPSVSGNITYTMTCAGAGGSASKSVTVAVNAPATITPPPASPTVTLSASPATIIAGQSVTLTWTSANAVSCGLTNGATGFSATSGSKSLTLTTPGTYTYTMQCTNANGTYSVPSSVTVAANAAPVAPTVTVSANPSTITQGQSVTILWSSTNAASCSLNTGATGLPTTGNQTILPSATGVMTYTVTCTGAGGSASNSVTVTVNAPVVTSPTPTVTLSANPTAVTAGQATTLSWTSTNAVNCSLSTGVSGLLATSGSQAVTVSSNAGTYTYTMTCANANGVASTPSSVNVTVSAAPSVPTVTLSASPSTITQGQSVTLTWSSAGTTSCGLDNDIGSVPTSGSQTVTPSVGGTVVPYTIFCIGAGGTAASTAAVNVTSPSGGSPPPLYPYPYVTLLVYPSTVPAGQSVTFAWKSANTVSCSMSGNPPGFTGTSGTNALIPPVTPGTYTYTMQCLGTDGYNSTPSSVSVTVTSPTGMQSSGQSSQLANILSSMQDLLNQMVHALGQ